MRNRCLQTTVRLIIWTTLVLSATACGAPALHPADAPVTPEVAALLPGLPELPAGADDPVQPRAASLTDNVQNGIAAVKSSSNAIFINGTGLDIGPPGKNKVGWAYWRWGAFQNNNKPRVFKADLEIAAQYSYYLVLADYSLGHWQIIGPTKGPTNFTLTPGDNYVSPTGNAYAGLLVTNTNILTVHTVDMICDNDTTPPAAPTALTASAITPHSARLSWTVPTDGDLDHFELFYHIGTDFVLSDPGVTQLGGNIGSTETHYDASGLVANTNYYFRIRSVDHGVNASALSGAAAFKTKANGPPVPAFQYLPTDVQKNVAITFDPSTTTDPDDAPAQLTSYWDWNNDGTDDDGPLTGLPSIQHTFTAKGPVTVKLTVSDGTASVSTTQSFSVGQHIEIRDVGFSTSGSQMNLLLASADYTTGHMAALVNGGSGQQKLNYFNGSAWVDLDVSQFANRAIGDVAVHGNAVDIATTLRSGGGTGPDLLWSIQQSTGGPWTQVQSGTITGHPLGYGAKLAYSAAGKVSLGIAAAIVPAIKKNPNTAFYIYHEKTDGTLLKYTVYQTDATSDPLLYNIATPQFSLRRDETTTSCAYTQNWEVAGPGFPDADYLLRFKVGTASVTDGGGSAAALYDTAVPPGPLGTAVPVGCQSNQDPADASKMYWAILSSEGTIYYGDNFGSANDSSEQFKPAPAATELLGAGIASDNQCLAYYTAVDAAGVAHAFGFKSQGSVTYDPMPGVGSISNGWGSWLNSGGDGLYIFGAEPRDGEVTGRFIRDGVLTRTDPIAKPLESLPTGDQSIAFITPAGGLEVLNRQGVPTALRHSGATVGGALATTQLGLDTWAYPQAGASGTVAGDIILGSTYDPAILVLSRFSAGNNVGSYLASYTDAAAYAIAYNPALNQTGVVYSQNGGHDLVFRSWNGAALSGPSTVFSGGAATIASVVLRARPDGQWGAAWDDLDSNVRMAETSGGNWQAANTLSAGPATTINLAPGSLGMEYASNGDAGLAVERSNGATGLYYGLKAAGNPSAVWSLVSATQGFNVHSINVHSLLGTTPVVVYHDSAAGMEYAQNSGGSWTVINLPFYLSGSPVVSVMDNSGTLAVAGKNNSTGQAAVCFLFQ